MGKIIKFVINKKEFQEKLKKRAKSIFAGIRHNKQLNAYPFLSLKHLHFGDYWLKLAPEAAIALITLAVVFFNWWQFGGERHVNYGDESHAARFLVNHPDINPKLYARQATVKILVEKGIGMVPQASANFLAQNRQQEEEEAVMLNEDYALSLLGVPGGDLASLEIKIEDDDGSEHKPFEYEVEGGDTLSAIAERYGLTLTTILWANDLTEKSVLKPGQKLTLLPTDGVLHEVKKGDTIEKIALAYKGEARNIIAYNSIGDAAKIHAGDKIIIPGGKMPVLSFKPRPGGAVGTQPPKSSGKLVWPTTAKLVTQGYHSAHRGLDFANGGRPPIYAAHSGVVEYEGKQGDWGITIVVRGDDGLVTRYSHNTENYVKVGQRVAAGELIGKVGNTGRVRGRTGLHLDFRIYKNGVAVNPLPYLK